MHHDSSDKTERINWKLFFLLAVLPLSILSFAEVVMAANIISKEMSLLSVIFGFACVAVCYPGLDFCRMLTARFAKRVKYPMLVAEFAMIACLFVLPLFPTALLYGSTLLFPQVGESLGRVGLFLTWQAAAGIAILHCFLRYCDMPASIRGLRAFLKSRAYSS